MEILGKYCFSKPKYVALPYSWLQHTPFAFFVMEMLKPKVFVELGTHSGNSYFSFCQASDELKLDNTCYAVDNWKGDEHSGFYGKDVFERVQRINSKHFAHFSQLMKMSFDDALSYFGDESIDLIHIDGLHTYDAVKHDFDSWLPKMSKKGVVLLHDTNVKERQFGVWKLFEEKKKDYPSFELKHGHGLGILCVGAEVCSDFLQFVHIANNDAFYQSFFAALGGKVLSLHRYDDLESEHGKVRKELMHQSNQTAHLMNKLEKVQGESDSGSRQMKELASQKEAINAEVFKKNEELTDLRRKISLLEKELSTREEQLQKSSDLLNNQIAVSENNASYVKTQNEEMSRKVEELRKEQQKNAILYNELLSFQRQAKELNDTLAKQSKEAADAMAEQRAKAAEDLEKQRKEAEAAMAEQRAKAAEDLAKQRKEAEAAMAEQSAKAAEDLEKQRKEAEAAMAEQGAKAAEDLAKQRKESEAAFEKQKEESDAKTVVIERLKNETAAQIELINQKDEQLRETEHLISELKKGLSNGSDKLKLLERRLSAYRFGYKKSKDQQLKLQVLLTSYEGTIDDQKKALHEANDQQRELKEHNSRLLKEVESLTNERDFLQKRNKEFKRGVHELSLLLAKHGVGESSVNKLIGQQERVTEYFGTLFKALNNHFDKLTAARNDVIRQNERLFNALQRKEKELNFIKNSISWKITRPLRFMAHAFIGLFVMIRSAAGVLKCMVTGRGRGIKNEVRLIKEFMQIKKSGLFDSEWYETSNPDVKKNNTHPLLHFVRHGVHEGRNPNPKFDVRSYLLRYPDVAQSGINPLVHYYLYGKSEGRSISGFGSPAPKAIQALDVSPVLDNDKRMDFSVLQVIHEGEGGLNHTATDLARSISSDVRSLMLKTGTKKWAIFQLKGSAIDLLQEYRFTTCWSELHDLDTERLDALQSIVSAYNPGVIHLRVLIGNGASFIRSVKSYGIPLIFSFHDFSSICPNTQLINNGRYCGGDCSLFDAKNDCKYPVKWFGTIARLRPDFKKKWLNTVNEAISLCDTYVVTSKSTIPVVTKYFDRLNGHDFILIEHGRHFEYPALHAPEIDKKKPWDIIFFGTLNEAKGCALVLDIMQVSNKRGGLIKLHVFGQIDGYFFERFNACKNVQVYGPYSRDTLSTRLSKIRPVLALLPSIWPETYSHTLTESWALGLPVLGSSYGAIGERITETNGGWVLEPMDAEKWYRKIVNVLTDKRKYNDAVEAVKNIRIPSLSKMAGEYLSIYQSLYVESLQVQNRTGIRDVAHKTTDEYCTDEGNLIDGANPCTSLNTESVVFQVFVEQFKDGVLYGWAMNRSNPDIPVELDVMIDGVKAVSCKANLFREDLLKANMGTGHHGFEASIPESLCDNAKHKIELRVSDYNLPLSGRAKRNMLLVERPKEPKVCLGELDKMRKQITNQPPRNNLLLVAHYVGDKLFGSERSFLDIISALDSEKYNVYVALPSYSELYVSLIKPMCDKIFVFPYRWHKYGLSEDIYSRSMFRRLIHAERIDLVVTNTIVLREPLIAARECNVQSACCVREIINHDTFLEKRLNTSPSNVIKDITSHSDFIIANSMATLKVFAKAGYDFLLYNSVDHLRFDIPNIVQNERIYVGMIGNNIAKKGTYELLELAEQAQSELPNVMFRLIGPYNNDTHLIEENIKSRGLKNIEISGYVDDPVKAVEKVNICLNFSLFAESFGRSVLEAMAARRPVIAYNWGALPELVEHGKSGYIIPYRFPTKAIDHLKILCANPELIQKLGEHARNLVIRKFSFPIFKRKLNVILDSIIEKKLDMSGANQELAHGEPGLAPMASPAAANSLVSVIIPNYNYAQYLQERLSSILNQTYRNIEIIFLDDCSEDNSLEVAREILRKASVSYKVIPGDNNQGTYKQWAKGIQAARGEFIWIAEADDACHNDMLKELLSPLQLEDVVMSFCQSKRLDEHGEITSDNNLQHTNDLDTRRWLKDYVEIGVREVVDYMCYRNTIPNVSACLFKAKALKHSLEGIDKYMFCGDWFLYTSLLKNGKIAYVSKAHNYFRRHSNSITNSNNRSESYLRELMDVKSFIIQNFPIHQSQIKTMIKYIDKDYKIEGLVNNSDSSFVTQFLTESQPIVSHRKRFVFLTTNNGSHNGGSEVLWIETSKYLRQFNHDVIVVIKKWEPRPALFDDLETMGIKLVFKNGNELDEIKQFRPDLIIVSTGDQDEGIEYYAEFNKLKLAYCIINQLTKQIEYWPVRKGVQSDVLRGYLNASKVFFTCKNNQRVMEERLGSKIPNTAIHYNPFHFDRNIKIPFPDYEGGVKIAVPARLLKIHKGQHLIIELFSQDRWRNSDICLNFYGDGPDRDEYQQMIKQYEINNIKIHPRTPEIRKIWESNHAILLPSFMEGLPIVLVGAMVCARVPIVTDIGGHKEVVEDNVSGFIAQKPDIRDIEEALIRAIDRLDEWEDIGKKAREHILRFLPDNPVQNFVQQLLKIL